MEANDMMETNQAEEKAAMREKLLEDREIERVVEFDELFRREPQRTSAVQKLRGCCRAYFTACSAKRMCFRNFPFLKTMRKYKAREYLPSDFISGLTVGIFFIPQGMAYSLLATLPPICGLYMSLFTPFVYFFIGSSRHLSMGCIAIVSLMMASVLERELGDSESFEATVNSTLNQAGYDFTANTTLFPSQDIVTRRKIQTATAVSFVSGLVMILFGKLGFGIVTTYMSESLVSGFTTGAATHIFTSQIKNALGLRITRHNGAFKIIKFYVDMFKMIHTTNVAALVTSLICIVVLYVIKVQVNTRFKAKMRIPIPIEIIVVILGTLASRYGMFEEKYGVSVVGEIPAGLPFPELPDPRRATSHISDAVVIGIVAFAQSISMAKILARKEGYKIDANQEMVAYGTGSVVNSFFSGYIPAGSVGRSMIQEGTGGRTQVASLFSCCLVFVVIMAIGPLFYSLPKCVLSAIIILSLRSMFLQIFELKHLWKTSKYDFTTWIVTFGAVVVVDADIGLGVGILVAIITVVVRTQKPKSSLLGLVSSTNIYKTNKSYQQVREIDGVRVVAFEAPVYFANADIFLNAVYEVSGINPTRMKRKGCPLNQELIVCRKSSKETGSHAAKEHLQDFILPKKEDHKDARLPSYLIIDSRGVNFIDLMGIKAFRQVIHEFEEIGVKVKFAACNDNVVDALRKNKFLEKHGDSLYLTLGGAVSQAVHELEDEIKEDNTGSKLGESELSLRHKFCSPGDDELIDKGSSDSDD